jgi:hypothetical protein
MGGVYSLRANAWQTIHLEEAFDHPGAPFRLGLLDESGNLKVMLLDHIPHNDASTADFDNETRFQPYRITVFIPDVACARCSLQLVAVMTDDTIGCGVPTCAYYSDDSSCSGWSPATPDCGAPPPDAVPCKRPATCYTSYHSCADVSINGSIPIDSTAGTQAFMQPSSWPHAFAPQSAGYGYENATWSSTHWLTQPHYPIEFTTMAGDDLCTAVPSPYIRAYMILIFLRIGQFPREMLTYYTTVSCFDNEILQHRRPPTRTPPIR